MFRRKGNMAPEEIFTRSLFGLVMVASFFAEWGRWVTLVLGILFLISAAQGFCITCVLYKMLFKKPNEAKD